MNSELIAAFLVIVFCVTGAFGEHRYASYAFGKKYVSTITNDALENSPKWEQTDENPPVSVRAAIKLADAKRAELVKDRENYKWRRKHAKLIFEDDDGSCYWQIHYEAEFQGSLIGIPPYVDVYILMDGTVLDPKMSDDK